MSDSPLTFLYRGSLTLCNYACDYCPFGKTVFDSENLNADRIEVQRFVERIECCNDHDLSLMFIPWGEALIHEHYQQALIRLSHVQAMQTVAAQTNLSKPPDWLEDAEPQKTALWCTFHPTQTTSDTFLDHLDILNTLSIRYSIGMVGRDELFDAGLQLRKKLAPHVTFWVNPLDDDIDAYTPERIKQWSQLDPLFSLTAKHRQTVNTKCRCGDSVFTVSGNGDLRCCPFTKEVIGNIYNKSNILPTTAPPCPNDQCNCFIGYIHWETEKFQAMYCKPPILRIT